MLETEECIYFVFTTGSSSMDSQSLLEFKTKVGILEQGTEVETDQPMGRKITRDCDQTLETVVLWEVPIPCFFGRSTKAEEGEVKPQIGGEKSSAWPPTGDIKSGKPDGKTH